MDSNQATWDQGFGQITMLPVAAGGLPPKGQDFNGIINQISENIVYQSQGGRFKFSPEYAESIGGYPKGAILQSDDEKKEYQSLIDNNKVNFNTTSNISASWELIGSKYAIKTEVDLALLKKFDKENISGILGNDQSKVPSLGLFTTEVGKLQPKGNYQPAGDYATNTALSTGLAGKQPTGDYATNTALTNGLSQKLNTSSVVQSTGSSTTQVMSQNATSGYLNGKFDKSGGQVSGALSASGSVSAGKKVESYNNELEVYAILDTETSEPKIRSKKKGVPWVEHVFPITSGTLLNTGNIVQTTGTSVVNVISQKGASDAIAAIKPLGDGQKWVDVTSERQIGVTYTNTTGRTINMFARTAGVNNDGSLLIYVDDVVCSDNTIGGGSIGIARHCLGYATIPSGSKYKAEGSSLVRWVELK
ncbi:hypothetical protein ABN222_01530 [Providencia alcalifaciens]